MTIRNPSWIPRCARNDGRGNVILNGAWASLFVILNEAKRSGESTFGEASEFNSQLTIRNSQSVDSSLRSE
ncbi:MAG: hypothetical protein NZM06_00790 [Chloroherpetonaceae bacterium]|nr:hypothetical protein [Chloroherpetonaceae bacterium]